MIRSLLEPGETLADISTWADQKKDIPRVGTNRPSRLRTAGRITAERCCRGREQRTRHEKEQPDYQYEYSGRTALAELAAEGWEVTSGPACIEPDLPAMAGRNIVGCRMERSVQ